MPFLSHGGLSLRYERAGTGMPVVFLHGLAANHAFWDRQVALRQQLQLVRLDLRGHGDSSKPRGGYGMAAFAGDVAHLAAALQLPRCILLGWSMGGVVALEAAHLLGERLAGLVLVGTGASLAARSDYAHGLSDDERQGHLRLVEQDYKAFVRTLAGRLFAGEQPGLLQWVTQQMLRTPAHVAAAALAGIFEADERPSLPQIAVPTLVLHGRADSIFPVAAAEHLATHIPGARLVILERSGHAPMIEETDRFNSELATFVESVATGNTTQVPAVTRPSTSPAAPAPPAPAAPAKPAKPAKGTPTPRQREKPSAAKTGPRAKKPAREHASSGRAHPGGGRTKKPS